MLAGEYDQLIRVLDAPASEAAHLEYARWLLGRGDRIRAAVAEGIAQGIAAHDVRRLEMGLARLPPQQAGWARMVGARLVSALAKTELPHPVAHWLAVARPALELEVGPEAGFVRVGGTRLYGDPDLPRGLAWPTLADCRRWQPAELDPSSPCQFIAQIDLAQLAQSPAARALPKTGLLSVFAHHEWQHTGSAAICVRYFRDPEALLRVPHVETDEDNRRHPPYTLRFVEALTLPDPGGVHRGVIDVPDEDAAIDAFIDVANTSGGGLLGMLGHVRVSSGPDPSLDRDAQRLLSVPIDLDAVVIHHLTIRAADLRAGVLERAELAWVDFDA